jgi:phage terminase large subunit
VMTANPTRQDGYFFESHHKMRDRWSALHWDGRKSPLVSKQYVEDMTKKYGVDSPIFQVRVAGNFVTAVDGVIPLDWCIAARDRDVKPFANSQEIWGVDVARFGDDSSALAKRRGNVQVEPVQEWHGKDIMQTAGMIYMQYQDARNKPASINVDVIGMGAGVVDRLKELGLPVVGINVSESASVSDHYQRLRDELWFLCRDWLEAKDCKLADDDALIAELTTVKYDIAGSSGKIKVEGKDEMKKRGVASPNRADAWNLTFARVMPSSARWGKAIKYPEMGII